MRNIGEIIDVFIKMVSATIRTTERGAAVLSQVMFDSRDLYSGGLVGVAVVMVLSLTVEWG